MYNYWRAGASQPSRTTGTIFLCIYIIYMYMYVSSDGTHFADPRINCGTLYATPVGPRGITERVRCKLYVHVYFKNMSIFRISGFYREVHEVRATQLHIRLYAEHAITFTNKPVKMLMTKTL